MTICLCHGGICELSICCSWPGGGVPPKENPPGIKNFFSPPPSPRRDVPESFFFPRAGLLMAVRENQPLVPRTLWLENTAQEPPAGHTAKNCWVTGTWGL